MRGENTFADIVFSGAWQVRTAGGEYLDVDIVEGEPPQRWPRSAHIAASRAVARAMIDGDFAYVLYAATKPS